MHKKMTSEKANTNISEESLLGLKAFNVFNNYILSEVANENASLEKENVLLQPYRNHLNSVEIRSNDGHTILYSFPGLDTAIMKKAKDELIDVVISDCDGTSIPLATLRRVAGTGVQRFTHVYVSNQLYGEMSEASLHIKDNCIKVQLTSRNCGIAGKIDGLSIEDIRQLQSNEISDQQIRRYFMGEDYILSSPNATFTPLGFMMRCETEYYGIIKSACLLQMSTNNPMESQIQAKEKLMISMKDQLKEYHEVEAKISELLEQSKAMLPLAKDENHQIRLKQSIDSLEENFTLTMSRKKITEERLQECIAQNKIYSEEYVRPSQFDNTQFNDIQSQADTLRDLCFSVLNRSSDLEMLKTNRKIMKENMNKKDIHIRSTTVQISHKGETFNIPPDSGHQSDVVNGIEMWRVPIHNRSIDANQVHTLQISLAGIPFGMLSGRVFLNPNEPRALQLEIMLDFGGRLQG